MLNECENGAASLPAVVFSFWGVFIHYRAQPKSGKGSSRRDGRPWVEGRPHGWGWQHARMGTGWLGRQGGP